MCDFLEKLYILCLDKIEKQLGFGGSAGVFEVVSVTTGKRKALKIIYMSSKAEVLIGKVLGKKSPFLVHYDEMFSEGDNELIIMEFFPNGDLQKYLDDGNRMTEKVVSN
jgi:serine/threonine protein kinase